MTTTNDKLSLLNKLTKGETVIATFAVLQGTRNAQVISHLGVDAVVVDCEHGHINDSGMHDMVCAISGSNVSPLIRVRSDSPETLKRALDTGAHGILVPMVSTGDQARNIVNLSKFPPVGIRGQGGPFTCFEHGLGTPAEYVAQANSNIVMIMQIETKAGIENIDEICQVDGVDMVLIGPNDLALAMLGRLPARPDDEVYHDAIDRVVNSAKKYGKKVGMVVTDGEGVKRAKERFDFIILTNEVRALQAWFKREMAIARS